MNFALSEEQELLQEAARGVLGRVDTLTFAREALDGAELPDLWPLAREAGWPGLLMSEDDGGVGLDVFEAMLVLSECGRVLANLPLLGHLPATLIVDAVEPAGGIDRDARAALAAGGRRAAYLPARPPGDREPRWTVDPHSGPEREPAPVARIQGTGSAEVNGILGWVPDAPGADVLVAVCTREDDPSVPVAVLLEAPAPGISVTPVRGYDSTRNIGHVLLEGATGMPLEARPETLEAAWYTAQALIAAESLGAAAAALEMGVAYANERHTFGRPIGSYQAIKHKLVEMLRLQENGRSLLYFAGWARRNAAERFALAASAARSTGGRALDYAGRENLAVHGGIAATWEHDAPLFFRRAQLSRRLLAGGADATDRVAEEIMRERLAATGHPG